MNDLRDFFGDLDIYLFDQILKNRFDPRMSLLDAGCGAGRNLVYFLRQGFDVFAVDADPEAVARVRRLAGLLAPRLADDHFQFARIEELPFVDQQFTAVISCAVLHFADDEDHFNRMVLEMWRVLAPGGTLFVRLASTIGIEAQLERIRERRYLLPDGSERFLVDERFLVELTERLGGVWAEPLKTTVVQDLRSMTTWVICKDDWAEQEVREAKD